MDKHRYKEAEALFPEIELIQPENVAVNEWRKQIISEGERIEREKEAQKKQAELNRKAWADFQESRKLANEKRYYDALDQYDELLERQVSDKKFIVAVKEEIKRVEQLIASERDPHLAQGKQLEQDGKLGEAFKEYEKAHEVDPVDELSVEGMNRIRGTLTSRARSIYAEGVFAESYSDMDTAEKRYREVLEAVPKDDDYYEKAQIRLKKLTVLNKHQGEPPQ
jgi:tetratricopeptide (TPR) repeat protein